VKANFKAATAQGCPSLFPTIQSPWTALMTRTMMTPAVT
jgi:hypothetical protein